MYCERSGVRCMDGQQCDFILSPALSAYECAQDKMHVSDVNLSAIGNTVMNSGGIRY